MHEVTPNTTTADYHCLDYIGSAIKFQAEIKRIYKLQGRTQEFSKRGFR